MTATPSPGGSAAPHPSSPFPAFDAAGNLPIGNLFAAGGTATCVVHSSLAQLHQRFVREVVGSVSRPSIFDGWMNYRRELDAFGVPYAMLIDGSFVTEKVNPGDIDICVVSEAAALDALPSSDRARLRALFDIASCKSRFHCDPYILSLYPLTHPRFGSMIAQISYWTRVFGIDRKGNQKALVLITQAGTL